jgi:hypothetical protein
MVIIIVVVYDRICAVPEAVTRSIYCRCSRWDFSLSKSNFLPRKYVYSCILYLSAQKTRNRCFVRGLWDYIIIF